MDLFYKPALERFDECAALEDNYMNCLFQKALKDRVVSNMCNLDSILWFHLECPKASSKFDNPIEYKQNINDRSEEYQRVASTYKGISYPEDLKERKELRQYQEIFDQHSPSLRPEPEDQYEEEDLNLIQLILVYLDDVYDADVKEKDMVYQDPEWHKTRPITMEDTKKFAPQQEVAEE